jgi:hypothetical protein
MNRIKIVCWLLIPLFLISCRSIEIAQKSKVLVDSLSQTQSQQIRTQDVSAETTSTSIDNSILSDSIYVKTTITEYSRPDSTGHQYIERTTTTERTCGNKKLIHTKTEIINNSQLNSKESKSDITHGEVKKASFVDKETVSKSKTPTWMIIASSILSVGLLVLVYLILKRFKIVK